MLKSLYSKIAVVLLILFLMVGLIFIGITFFSTDMYQKELNQKLNSDLAEQIVKESLLMEEGKVNHDAVKKIFHMLMVINPGIEIYLLDPEGRILTYSAPAGSVKRNAVDLEPVIRWLKKETNAPVLGDDPKDPNRRKVFSAAVIEQNGIKEGYLYVILGGAQYDSVVDKVKGSYILQLSVWMMGAGLLFSLIAGLLLFALLTGRLKKLAARMDTFIPGEPVALADSNAKKSGSDEIDRLSQTFAQMARRIEAQMEQLKASDRIRRELVANVSHDLRTPLATLQGYIETLLIKDRQHSEDQRRQYLETAIDHCRRLNRLVSDLLEISHLESARIQVSPEPFNFVELVSDVVQKFALTAAQKKIDVIPQIDEGIPFAMADIRLVERAIENLLENALHHTPHGGEIHIGISCGTDIVFTISDTGPGISGPDLKRIFNRYYQSGKDGSFDRKHVGLGLAITHKILTLHNKSIRVKSEPGKGTCFTFYLPPDTSLQ